MSEVLTSKQKSPLRSVRRRIHSVGREESTAGGFIRLMISNSLESRSTPIRQIKPAKSTSSLNISAIRFVNRKMPKLSMRQAQLEFVNYHPEYETSKASGDVLAARAKQLMQASGLDPKRHRLHSTFWRKVPPVGERAKDQLASGKRKPVGPRRVQA